MRVEKIGLATLYLGDCREIAAGLERPAAVISDPPYGMKWDTDSARFSGGVQAVSRGKNWNRKTAAHGGGKLLATASRLTLPHGWEWLTLLRFGGGIITRRGCLWVQR